MSEILGHEMSFKQKTPPHRQWSEDGLESIIYRKYGQDCKAKCFIKNKQLSNQSLCNYILFKNF